MQSHTLAPFPRNNVRGDHGIGKYYMNAKFFYDQVYAAASSQKLKSKIQAPEASFPTRSYMRNLHFLRRFATKAPQADSQPNATLDRLRFRRI